MNDTALQAILKMLKTNREIVHTTDYLKVVENDYREAFSPKAISDPSRFPEYYQVFSAKFPFAPDLSILDLIFNEGPASLHYFSGYATLT